MADQHKSDIVMKFVTKDQGDVLAECALDKNKDDTFMTDFQPQTYDSFSNFFEVAKFNFGFEVKDESQSKSVVSNDKGGGRQASRAQVGRVQGEFASWRSADQQQASEVLFQLDFESFRFERLIDSASVRFFEHCCTSKSFASAAMVKRVALGGNATPQGFLRIDFQHVLITSLSWDDGDMTTEKCEFICRDFKLKYRQQAADGSFGANSSAEWNYKKNALPSGRK